MYYSLRRIVFKQFVQKLCLQGKVQGLYITPRHTPQIRSSGGFKISSVSMTVFSIVWIARFRPDKPCFTYIYLY